MTRYKTLDHPIMRLIGWDPLRPAEYINDHIAMVHATSNVYLVTGAEGDVLINSGTTPQGEGVRGKLEALLGRTLNVRKLIFTQSHPDHIGGWKAFSGPETKIYAQRAFHQLTAERRLLAPFFGARYANVIAAMLVGMPRNLGSDLSDPENVITFGDSLEFTFGDRRFELISMPSGETLDSLAVWLPDENTVFTGNWAGAIYGALPNFYTARGDRQRSVPGWLRECDRLLAREPEVLITGHGEPVFGKERIRSDLMTVRDAVASIHDHTVEAMNAGVDVATIQATCRLPDGLVVQEGRCPPHWIARAVYEEYAGWFHQERTSELYPTPPSAIWAELLEDAGGIQKLLDRAQHHLSTGEIEKALHFVEMAVVVEPTSQAVRLLELAVLEELADRTEGKVFDMLGWLEGRIMAAKDALQGPA